MTDIIERLRHTASFEMNKEAIAEIEWLRYNTKPLLEQIERQQVEIERLRKRVALLEEAFGD